MKAAIVYDNGEVETYGDIEQVTKSLVHGRLSLEIDVNADADGVQYERLKGHRVKDGLIKFFGLDAIKTGVRIPKSDIRKGDLIRVKDHGEPVPGERDYKTLEFVATEDGDASYLSNRGEKFYLLDRPKPKLPTAPGSVVKVRVPGYGVQHIVLGNDGLWRGPNVKAEGHRVREHADVVEVVA